MKDVKVTINLRIRDYLKEHGITQTWLANKTNISIKKINTIVNGNTRLDANDLNSICNALQVSADIFLN